MTKYLYIRAHLTEFTVNLSRYFMTLVIMHQGYTDLINDDEQLQICSAKANEILLTHHKLGIG